MTRWARLNGDVVATVVESPVRPNTRGQWVAASYTVAPGHRWTGSEWLPPAVAVPAQIAMRQLRLALLSADKLAQAQDAIDLLDEPARSVCRIEWEYATAVPRRGPLVAVLAPALGLSEALVDALFIDAARL